MKVKVTELQPGMLVELQGDKYGDEGVDDFEFDVLEYEYAQVDEIEDEGKALRVDFTNYHSIGFPHDHEVEVVAE